MSEPGHESMTKPAIFKIKQSLANKTFSPRIGQVSTKHVSIDTPGFTTCTSRGVVPHLTADHVASSSAARWLHVPFETFLERMPPLPTLQRSRDPLRNLLGYSRSDHILTLALRDPSNGHELPANGKDYVNALCVRGVRKVTTKEWRSYSDMCDADFVLALSDTPFTPPPYSQKRITKSIERSTAWLATILQSSTNRSPADAALVAQPGSKPQPSVLVHMSGDISNAARIAFASALTETLHGKESDQVAPLRALDEGVSGYVFDLVPLRASLLAELPPINTPLAAPGTTPQNPMTHPDKPSLTSRIASLMHASLADLPVQKLRIVNTASGPHEMLRLIQDVGIDMFDAHCAQKAADWGVALDFTFPVSDHSVESDTTDKDRGGLVLPPRAREDGIRDLGHNLYDTRYATDFSRFSACFLDGYSNKNGASSSTVSPICPCIACTPRSPVSMLSHASFDKVAFTSQHVESEILPAHTRAYVHHLLHTHEMSAHALLAAHNLAVLDAFFEGVRRVLAVSLSSDKEADLFDREAERFCSVYDGSLCVFEEAKRAWIEVDLARGKGRLAREKLKQAETSLATEIQVEV